MSDDLLPDDNWAYSDGQRDGAENEREAIVAWLRSEAEIQVIGANVYAADTDAHWFAKCIESGEHLVGDDE